jgi:dihydrofolate synthase / folylpolyglutamate synthase
MLSTKDHEDIFEVLLKPNDALHLVPVPDHSSADPEELVTLALQVCPQLNHCQTHQDVFTALDVAIASQSEPDSGGTTVLCGSLYLIGHLFKHSDLNNSSKLSRI